MREGAELRDGELRRTTEGDGRNRVAVPVWRRTAGAADEAGR